MVKWNYTTTIRFYSSSVGILFFGAGVPEDGAPISFFCKSSHADGALLDTGRGVPAADEEELVAVAVLVRVLTVGGAAGTYSPLGPAESTVSLGATGADSAGADSATLLVLVVSGISCCTAAGVESGRGVAATLGVGAGVALGVAGADLEDWKDSANFTAFSHSTFTPS